MSGIRESELTSLRKLAEEMAKGRGERATTGHLLAAIAAGTGSAADLLNERRLASEALLPAARGGPLRRPRGGGPPSAQGRFRLAGAAPAEATPGGPVVRACHGGGRPLRPRPEAHAHPRRDRPKPDTGGRARTAGPRVRTGSGDRPDAPRPREAPGQLPLPPPAP